MKKVTVICVIVMLMVSVIAIGIAAADGPIPITADQAFDAVVKQKVPGTCNDAKVKLVDLRTTAEYYWVGACAKVEKIIRNNNEEITPVDGKVKIVLGGRLLIFKVEVCGRKCLRFLGVRCVKEIQTSHIAKNIPYLTWDEGGCGKVPNEEFTSQIEELAEDYPVIILMCRSGKRTTECVTVKPDGTLAPPFDLFTAVYEIDQPDGADGHGGFQGSSYKEAYNGYRGFSGRATSFQDHPSVSWSDAGLPVKIGKCPPSGD